MKTGIIAALDGKTIKDTLAYDSRNKHLLINPKKSPKHMDIVEFRGGTAFTFNSSVGGMQEEILFSVPHGLDFIPRTACFFTVRDASPAFAPYQGLYGSFILISPGAPFTDMIFYGADKTNFYVKHRSICANDGGGSIHTSTAPDFLLRTKYMIFSNEAVQEPYEMSYAAF